MVEKANPAIVQLLLQHAQMQIINKEDSLVFGTSGNDLRNTSTNPRYHGVGGGCGRFHGRFRLRFHRFR